VIMKYKLLCMDMDGTLLNDEKVVSEINKEAIKKAIGKGVKAVICTGRMFTSAIHYSELLESKAPIISSNGAYIREKDRDEAIYKSVLGVNNCRSILEILNKYGMAPNFHTPDSIFTDRSNDSYKMYSKYNQNALNNKVNIQIVDNWEDVFDKYKDDIVKCITIDNDLEKIRKAKSEMAQNPELEVVSSFENNFEVMQKGVSKGRGVEVLAAYYGIDREEVICIGDNENDLTMIQYAGLGIAMGNSDEEIKEIADYITATNNEDGVAKAIERFILEN
jgi:Cof subfamily protein (haloacid dehalogenase superfamily)